MNKKLASAILFAFSFHCASAQLYINSAQLTIQTGASVVVQGDVTSNTNILGDGKIVLNGSAAQNVSMSGNTIPNLEVNNTANATLTSDARIGSSIVFTNGKIVAGNYNLTLSDVATASGMADSKFVETSGTGQVYKELTANVTSSEIPVGVGTTYRPAFLTTSGTYASAKAGFKASATAAAAMPVRISDYTNASWPVTVTGVTGTVNVAVKYVDPTDVVGTESNLRGYFYNGTDWSSAGTSNDATANKVGVTVTGAGGIVTGMDKFVLVGARAFLQGCYVAGTGLMIDVLRSASYLPTTDPYRATPYSTSFTHVNNATTESVVGTPFTTNATVADNIVDWVYLELRNTNASPGNTILQTRSALIQRDGDIVDVDGVSPVTFNNIADGNYALTVRHRNHLAISSSPTAGSTALGEAKSTAYTTKVIDLRTAPSNKLYGTSTGYTTAAHPTLTTVNLMWGGNANSNTNSRYSGASNDRAAILTDLGSELTTQTGYKRSDLNMNGTVKYSGAGNDRAYLLSTVLSSELTVRTQQIPN